MKEHKEIAKRYEEKQGGTGSPLEQDPGNLGHVHAKYEQKVSAGHSPQKPTGSTNKAHIAYGPKARDKYRGGGSADGTIT